MRTAGLTLDFYDDLNGAFLKQAFPTLSALPEVIKEAHILSSEERDVLRDEAFALILHDNGKTLRKFACVDEGNTVLSVIYFMENYDKLPEEAIKVAAANLESFCEEFGLEAPLTVKLAAKNGMSRKRDSMKQPTVSNDADWAQRTNLVSLQGGADSGRVIPTASQMKTAEVLGGGQVLTDDKKDVSPKMQNPIKAGIVAGVKGFKKQVKDNQAVFEKNYDVNLDSWHKLNPGSKPKHAGVDVSGLKPILTVQKTAASRTALDGKYALDSMADVQRAVSFFEENYKDMDPADAHTFAVKTAARAEELGIHVTEKLARYGSTTYASDVDAQMSSRIANSAPEFKGIYKELREKVAEIEPEQFAQLLREADEVAGLNFHYHGKIVDPYQATFGKTASVWSWTSRTGDFVTESELKHLARNGRPLVHKHFSSELTNAFIKEPLAIFESLPDDSKCILARLAADRFDGLAIN